MPPPDQGLDARHRAVLHGHDRLVVQLELAPVDGVPEFDLEVEPAPLLGVGVVAEDLEAVPSP